MNSLDPPALRILMVEDSPTDAKLVERTLARQGISCETRRVDDEPGLRRAFAEQTWELVLCDWGMPRFDGMRALELTQELSPETSFLIVSGTVGEEVAARAVRRGAADFVSKSRLEHLGAAIARELREREARATHRATVEILHEREAQLQHAQKMEAVGTLAGGIAHDFNNLLTIVLGYADEMARSLPPDMPQRQDLDQIRMAGLRAADLTRRLLAFGRRQVLQPQVTTLNQIVESVEPMWRSVLGEGVEIVVALDPVADWCMVDPGQIENVLMNLVVNARDAMPTGGRLTIETKRIDISAEYAARRPGTVPGPHAGIVVTDTGCGMSEDTQARMFEPFFTTKPPGSGTGLGLATVFGVVHQSGGHLRVTSQEGRGTSFCLCFPVRSPSQAPQPTRSMGPLKGGQETILLAEDNADVRALLGAFLRDAGYRVLVAEDGEAALRLAEAHGDRIDLLCTDVIMPSLSGRELADRLEAQRPGVRVLFVSGYPGSAVANHGVDHHQVTLLQKPLTRDQVLRKVREVLDR